MGRGPNHLTGGEGPDRLNGGIGVANVISGEGGDDGVFGSLVAPPPARLPSGGGSLATNVATRRNAACSRASRCNDAPEGVTSTKRL